MSADGVRRGLVALGDSITVADVPMMPGVPSRSWALWLAAALELPYTGLASHGARAGDVLDAHVPRLRGPYDLACLYVGVNDVRDPGFDADAYAARLDDICTALGRSADRLALVSIPLDLGRPRAGAKVATANGIIRDRAAEHGGVVVPNEDTRGWREVLPDAVHLTAYGQLALARRAARALGASDAPLAGIALGPRRLARYAATGQAPAVARDWRRRAVEAWRSLLVQR